MMAKNKKKVQRKVIYTAKAAEDEVIVRLSQEQLDLISSQLRQSGAQEIGVPLKVYKYTKR